MLYMFLFRFYLQLQLFPLSLLSGAKSQMKLETFEDLKLFKKFLRTKTNVLVLFAKDEASIKPVSSLLTEVATATKGKQKNAMR